MAHARTSMLAASLALLPIALGPGGAAGGPTSLRFVAYDDAAQAGVHFTSLTWNASVADVDGDGREDLLAGRHYQAPAILFRNQGDRTFAEIDAGTFLRNDRHDCQWGDANHDGLLDVYCALGAEHGGGEGAKELWIQAPDHTFTNRGAAYGVTDPLGRGRFVTFIDVNHDPYVDLFLANTYPRIDGGSSPNRLFINQGGTSYLDSPDYGLDIEVGGTCARAADVNEDTWTDLLVCGKNAAHLYRNNAGASFTDITATAMISGRWLDATVGDVTGDGHLDIVAIVGTAIQLRKGTGAGRFGSITQIGKASAGVAVALGDADGDGHLDVYVASTCSDGANTSDVLLLNRGTGVPFAKVAVPAASGCASGVAAIRPMAGGPASFFVLNGHKKTAGPTQLITTVPCTMQGTSAGEAIGGTANGEAICAAGGDDTVTGGGGIDLLFGEDGNDTLQGADGEAGDVLVGGAGVDTCTADLGDVVQGCEA